MCVMSTDGSEICFETAVELMDDDLREEIHHELAPCEQQKFYDEYCARHMAKFGMEFNV